MKSHNAPRYTLEVASFAQPIYFPVYTVARRSNLMEFKMATLVLQAIILVLTAEVATGCGGYLVGSGNITSPNYPSLRTQNGRCTWTLAAPPGQYISLQVLHFDTESTSDCIYVCMEATAVERSKCYYVNPLSESHTMTLLVAPNTTVRFVGGYSNSESSFYLEYTTVNITPFNDCGGSLVGSGNITSPNYPNFYPRNSRCTWTLSAGAGNAIELRRIYFDTQSTYDYVNIYNGSATVKNYFTSYSGLYYDSDYYGEYKPMIFGPNVTVMFVSDNTTSRSGFQFEFISFNATLFTDCGGHLVGSGKITSPNYPSVYPNNSYCAWTLRSRSGKAIALRHIFFDMESISDYVNIYNGSSTAENCISSYSGSSDQVYYRERTKPLLLGPTVTVLFVSDSSTSGSGFQFEFMSVQTTPYTVFADCGGQLVGSGNITSPQYPNLYPNNRRCTWNLSANAGYVISLRVINFASEPLYDYVNIYNGVTSEINCISRLSGRYDYDDYYAKTKPLLLGPNVTVLFVSDSSTSDSGFQFEFMSINATPFTDCGGYLVGSGNITSPNFPSFYPNNSRCTWQISASAGYSIALRSIHIDMESTSDCVNIYNGSMKSNNFVFKEAGRSYYGSGSAANEKPRVIGPNVTVQFRSDSFIAASGFQIEYTSVNTTPFTDCGGYLIGFGNITSPNYPSFYPNNSRCLWTLYASAGYVISLRIIHLNLEDVYDQVQLYNGSATPNNEISLYNGITHFRGHQIAKPLLLGPLVRVSFISDCCISAPGFQIEFSSINATPFTDCGGHLVGSGNITSPNFPSVYPNNCQCTWTLAANAGYVISLRVIYVDTEPVHDKVDIYRGSQATKICVATYTSGNDNDNYNYASAKPLLLGPLITIEFMSDNAISASGFQVEYSSFIATPFTDCGGRFVGSGNVTSPNYPSFYPDNCNCTWTLAASTGLVISLRVIYVDTEPLYDEVQIYNGSAIAKNRIPLETSRTNKDNNIYPSAKDLLLGPIVTVVFISDNSISSSGFKIEYSSFNATPVTEFNIATAVQLSGCFKLAFPSAITTILLATAPIVIY